MEENVNSQQKKNSKKCPMTSLCAVAAANLRAKKIDRVMSTCRSLLLKLKFLGQFTLRPEILFRVTQKRIQEVQEAFRRPKMTLKSPELELNLLLETLTW